MNEKFTPRLATLADIPQIRSLMDAAIFTLQKEFLTPDQITASVEAMGLDTTLIEDSTYFVILDQKTVVGCGGWSRRATLFGGNQTIGRDDALLNPAQDPARIRAMYTHPDWKRQGIGRMILGLCEAAAQAEGFHRLELAATLAGVPLYRAAGYHDVEKFTAQTSQNIDVPLVRMAKNL
ncbi:GNAT family N-acetyltransferase [Paremcibacter congregatus]|jgi:GNAT superfamily N-acetyltransferase|uniref:GNAT family N-acetyltransferase n=1 Tax=Paremcibacter congregatus TaxID=2043170 RepID=UPI0030EC9382|tara:strand:+ start:1845 stop:2381 length:537 start_codon:yes stop_codon:yes gene_type:complete